MITVTRYLPKFEKEWNAFVKTSANGTFLLDRRYMDYHKNRFSDHSLMFSDRQKLVAILPANQENKKIISHGGLTYGGLIVEPNTKLFTTLTCMFVLTKYYFQKGFTHILYKPVPSFFQAKPYYQDIYALFLLNAKLSAVNTGFVTEIKNLDVPKDGRYIMHKAKSSGVTIVRAPDCKIFWSEILVPHLKKKFNTTPVHTIEEIELLRKKFPTQILQYNAVIKNTIVAGVTIFLDRGVAHCQYIAGNDQARKTGANDYLMWNLLTNVCKNQKMFSFGTTNMGSSDGRAISKGLVAWKEGFHSAMYPYPWYDIKTKNYFALTPYI